MQFMDKAKIRIVSGKGGNGVVAWRREKFVDKGGPAGGDGGNGGSVYIIATESLSTLMDFAYKTVYKAENGENGFKKSMHGKSAKDLYINVPVGTIVKDLKTGNIIADLTEHEQKVLVAKGGKGGRGNIHFCTPQNRAPQYCEPGEPGIERELQLELKLIADVGLLGLPNAGKSTFISRVSAAKPKIADYPFTTIVPNLGVVRRHDGNGYVIADIPGLIEGASEGVGLGHDFLRHVERCRLLLHLVDVSGSEGRDPISDFETINKELAVFSPELSTRPQIVVANKIDMAEPEQIEEFKKYIEDKGLKFFTICAPIQEGTDELIKYVAKELQKLPPIIKYEAEEAPIEEVSEEKGKFQIVKRDNGYEVIAEWLHPLMDKTNPNDYEQLLYFQNVLEKSGIIDALRDEGVQNGDTVVIYDFEFDFVD